MENWNAAIVVETRLAKKHIHDGKKYFVVMSSFSNLIVFFFWFRIYEICSSTSPIVLKIWEQSLQDWKAILALQYPRPFLTRTEGSGILTKNGMSLNLQVGYTTNMALLFHVMKSDRRQLASRIRLSVITAQANSYKLCIRSAISMGFLYYYKWVGPEALKEWSIVSDNSPGGCRYHRSRKRLISHVSFSTPISADYRGTASLGLHKYVDRSRALRC